MAGTISVRTAFVSDTNDIGHVMTVLRTLAARTSKEPYEMFNAYVASNGATAVAILIGLMHCTINQVDAFLSGVPHPPASAGTEEIEKLKYSLELALYVHTWFRGIFGGVHAGKMLVDYPVGHGNSIVLLCCDTNNGALCEAMRPMLSNHPTNSALPQIHGLQTLESLVVCAFAPMWRSEIVVGSTYYRRWSAIGSGGATLHALASRPGSEIKKDLQECTSIEIRPRGQPSIGTSAMYGRTLVLTREIPIGELAAHSVFEMAVAHVCPVAK